MNVKCVFYLVLVTKLFINFDFIMELFLMTLSIKNGDYIKHLIKLVLYENDVKLLKFKRRPVDIDL